MTNNDIVSSTETIPNVSAEGQKSANVPNLRFLGFDDAWDYVRVSDLIETYSTNSLSWDMLDYENGTILNLHYGLIHSGLPTQINCRIDKLPFIKSEYMPKHYTLCEEGDVAFADASEDTEEVGKVVEFSKCSENNIVCGLHTIHARDKVQKTVVGYKGYAFSSVPFHHQIRRIAQGTKIYSINTRNFEEVYVGVPSKAEQRKIADFLSLIDDRINTQSKIIEKLQSFMKSICHTIFNKDKTKKLGDCVVCHASTLIEADIENSPSGIYPVFGATGVIRHIDTFDIEGNAILVLKDGANAGKIQFAKTPHSVIGTSNYLTPKDNTILKYVYFALLDFNFDKYKVGSGIPHIYFKDYKEEKIYYPSYEKQTCIVKLLSSIENKIDLESIYLDKLKEQKKYLLSNMFI